MQRINGSDVSRTSESDKSASSANSKQSKVNSVASGRRKAIISAEGYEDVLAQNMVLQLDKAIRKEQRKETGDKAERNRKFYKQIYFINTITIGIYMFMVFFGVPVWCLDHPDVVDRRN